MDAHDEARMRAYLASPVNPTGWPLLHLVAMFYKGERGEVVGLPMTRTEDGDWELIVPFDGRLFRVDTVYEDPETAATAVFWGGDQHKECRTGEIVTIEAPGS